MGQGKGEGVASQCAQRRYLKQKLIKMLAGNAQREGEGERENLHKINMQHFAVSAAGRHVSVWHVLHMQMCSQTRAATRAAQTFPLSLCSVYYNAVKFLPTCWTARGALGMQLDEVEELKLEEREVYLLDSICCA